MLVYIEDDKFPQSGIREHPWDVSEKDVNAKYYDFKKHPELIVDVLEDFKLFEEYESIQLFYEMIKWINGKSSQLETNDCFFMGITDNRDNQRFPFKLECRGRVMIFFRNLQYNTSKQKITWLIQSAKTCLEQCPQQQKSSCIGITFLETRFTDIPKNLEEQTGHEVVFKFWAWGNDKNETMNNLHELFNNLFYCLKSLTQQIQ